MKPAVIINNLTKTFGSITAISGLNLDVEEGKITGIIGPDGAGKSTLLRIVISLDHADSGSLFVLDNEVPKFANKLKGLVGYMPERFSLYPDLTVRENLDFYARIHDTTIEENYQIIKPIYSQLEPFNKRLAGKLSGGMKQKLALCCALIHRPKLLILDEPTTGVDAVSRKDFWDILKSLLRSGLTIIVSTPYMDEANKCDKIVLMHKGKLLSSGTPAELIKGYSSYLYRLTGSKLFEMKQLLGQSEYISDVSIFGKGLHLTVPQRRINIELLSDILLKQGFEDFQFEEILPGIEDCFLELLSEK